LFYLQQPLLGKCDKSIKLNCGKFVSYRWYFNDSAGNTNSTTIYNLTTTGSITCATPLSSAGQTYTLTNNVTSTGTCFTILNQNITLDCNGYWINYSTGGASVIMEFFPINLIQR